MRIEGATAFITGGGGGIGAGMAAALVEAGARVVLADVDLAAAEAAAAALPGEAHAVVLDVAEAGQWAMAKAAAEARVGPIDILCNHAGIAQERGPLDAMPAADFARFVTVNVASMHHGIAAFVPAMRERRRGHVVNTSSMLGLMPMATYATYAATKAAVLALSEALRQELAPFGVGVSALCPGNTRTRMAMRKVLAAPAERQAAMAADMMEPVWLGRAVVRAIVADAAYIVTHPEGRAAVAERFDATLAAFGDPAQPGFRMRD